MSVTPDQAAEQKTPFDVRQLAVVILVTAVMGLGVLYAWKRGPSFTLSFSSQVSLVYWPLGSILILALGWSSRYFPLVAGLFYGFLPLAQAAGDKYFPATQGDVVLTFEMALGLPLILCGFLGPAARGPRYRPLHPTLKLGWLLILTSAIISTIVAISPSVALGTLLARFVVPILVTLGTFRRLRSLDDYKIVWLGFVAGILLVTAFNVRRIVFGVVPWYATGIHQRYLGASLSFSFPALFIIGPALWYGHALAVRRSPVHGVPWIIAAVTLGLLFWLGAHRGPMIAFGLIVLWWLPRHSLRLLGGRGLFAIILLGLTAVVVANYLLGRTAADTLLFIDRLKELATEGVKGTSRYPLWMEALAYWKQEPFFGIGLNNWTIKNATFESCHSAFFGILIDTGLLGALAFAVLFGATLWFSRKSYLAGLNYIDREFVAGCRASWVVALLLMFAAAPFTSGQLKNAAFIYMVFFYPLLIMTIQARHAVARPVVPLASRPWQPGDAVVPTGWSMQTGP